MREWTVIPIATEPSMHDPCADNRSWPPASTERRNSMQQFATYGNVLSRSPNGKNSEPIFLVLKFRCLRNIDRFNQCSNSSFMNRRRPADRSTCAGGLRGSRPLVVEISSHMIWRLGDWPLSRSAGRVSSISGTSVSRRAGYRRGCRDRAP